jgi:cytochrome c biogenesis protein CcmG/thiol:disulfide interchange protein DsbE
MSSTEDAAPAEEEIKRPRNGLRIALALLPLIVFGLLAGTFYLQLQSGQDASIVPSALIGKPAPQFTLPAIAGLTKDGKQVPGLSTASLKGHVTLVNVWASWCVPCRAEQPMLMQLSQDKRFDLVAINYKDKSENARAFLDKLGNPFAAVGADTTGATGIKWGVYGVPETYLVSADGTILYKRVGPFTEDAIRKDLMPAVEKALRQTKTSAVTSSTDSPS